jgi:hypothetical protein
MPSISEFPSVVVESSLSQILMEDAPEKYFLTEKACRGILRRAEKKGMTLPDRLQAALIANMERTGKPT